MKTIIKFRQSRASKNRGFGLLGIAAISMLITASGLYLGIHVTSGLNERDWEIVEQITDPETGGSGPTISPEELDNVRKGFHTNLNILSGLAQLGSAALPGTGSNTSTLAGKAYENTLNQTLNVVSATVDYQSDPSSSWNLNGGADRPIAGTAPTGGKLPEEIIVCAPSQKIIDGECVNKTCQVDAYKCPECKGEQELKYNSDGSGYCELNCADSQIGIDFYCIDKTCKDDAYNCPTCNADEVLKYNDNGSGFCEKKPCEPPSCCAEDPQVCGGSCYPADAVCCETGQACIAGSVCTSTGCCPSDTPVECGDLCLPEGATCCSDGTACPANSVCVAGGCCPLDTPQTCGTGCMPEGADCCDGAGFCPAGSICIGNGECSSGRSSRMQKEPLPKAKIPETNITPFWNIQRSKNPSPFWMK